MQEVIVSISSTGEVTVEVQGVTGTQCLDITRGLEEQLGVVIDRQHKPEFYQVAEDVLQVWNRHSS